MTELYEAVHAWIEDDPDPVTRDELTRVLGLAAEGDAEARIDLEDRFAALLDFGTAGLRGALGAGPNRMNRAVVQRAAAGIARWVIGSEPDGASRGVVVGFDARHRSADFAEDSAAVLAAAGITVHLLPAPLPTPVLAFAVRRLGAAAGIMVTASHNPPEDNGYKVYDSSGSQITSPADIRIAEGMRAIGSVAEIDRDPDAAAIRRLDDGIVADYVDAASSIVDADAARDLIIAYTAMHGVGAGVLRRVFTAAGLPDPVEVVEQIEPDPDFPTVAFPNPEEPGALDLGLATAAAARADILLVNDPDADRLGVAVPDPALGDPSTPAGWRALRGDEIGVILAEHLLRHGVEQRDVVATTIVSSTLLRHLAERAGAIHRETLTGFKWLARAAGDGERLLYAYEEALGFAVAPDLVADKDGITAALVLTEAVARHRAEGRTVLDVLDDLARHHGVHLSGQWTIRLDGVDGLARIAGAMAALRTAPPTHLGDRPIRQVIDLAEGRSGADGEALPPSDVVILRLDGARVVIRPSGTEPKLKCYLEVVEPLGDTVREAHEEGRGEGRDAVSDLVTARRRATERLEALTAAVAALVDAS